MKFAKFLRTPFFTEYLRWLLLFFLKQISKNEKNIFTYIDSQENASDSVLFSKTVPGLRSYSFTKKKRKTILDAFCEICEVLYSLIL